MCVCACVCVLGAGRIFRNCLNHRQVDLTPESLIVAVQVSALRRMLKLCLNISRMHMLAPVSAAGLGREQGGANGHGVAQAHVGHMEELGLTWSHQAAGGMCRIVRSLAGPLCPLPAFPAPTHYLRFWAAAGEQLLPSRATVLHLRLPTDQRCSTAPQAGGHGCTAPPGREEALPRAPWLCSAALPRGCFSLLAFLGVSYSFGEIKSHI